MTLCRGESLLKFITSVLCKQHCYNNCLHLGWERDCKTFARDARWKPVCWSDFWIKANKKSLCAASSPLTNGPSQFCSIIRRNFTWIVPKSGINVMPVSVALPVLPYRGSILLSRTHRKAFLSPAAQTFACLQTGGGVFTQWETNVWPRVSDPHNPPVSIECCGVGGGTRSRPQLIVCERSFCKKSCWVKCKVKLNFYTHSICVSTFQWVMFSWLFF